MEPVVKRNAPPAPAGPPPTDSSSPKRPLDDPPDIAPAKKQVVSNPPSHKAGAISMFEGPDEQPAVSPAQPIGPPRARFPPPRNAPPRMPPGVANASDAQPNRSPRPPPPRMMPAGIPDGQPLPPNSKPDMEIKAAAPSRPPPTDAEGGRAPPKVDPEQELQSRKVILPPKSAPPISREKKPKEEIVLRRRERDMPEFEASDDEEEEANFVKQPLPFGVLKQDLPGPRAALETEQKKEAQPRDLLSTGTKSTVRMKEAVPLVAPTEQVDANEFVPAAPPSAAAEKHFDDSSLGKYLSRGRFLIKCIEGVDIRRKDDPDRNPRNDPYIRFRLGAAERHPWKSTETKRKQGSTPNFDNEIVFFNIVDPVQLIFQEDVQLCIELWNKSTTKNELVGSITMSVVRFLKQPFVAYTEKVPIYYPGATRSPMKVRRCVQLIYFSSPFRFAVGA